jgi:hypothetical protein
VQRLKISGNKAALSHMPSWNTQGQLYCIFVEIGCDHEKATLETGKWAIL